MMTADPKIEKKPTFMSIRAKVTPALPSCSILSPVCHFPSLSCVNECVNALIQVAIPVLHRIHKLDGLVLAAGMP